MAEKNITAMLLKRGRVAWTTLHERKGGLAVAVQQDTTFELPPEVTDAYAPEAAEALKGRLGSLRGKVAAAIPADLVLFRATRLPSTDAAELRSMAELQVDKVSPFLPEHSAMALEVLKTEEGQSRVLMATVQRDHIDRLGALCARVGLSPEAVDVDILGWWQLLQDEQRVPAHGRQLVVVVEADGATLVVAEDGLPILVRALGAGLPQAEMAAEIQYTLTTLETEWGPGEYGRVQLWHDGGFDYAAQQELQRGLGLMVDAAELSTLPPVTEGLARRAAARTNAMLDLAPEDWKASLRNLRARKTAFAIGGAILGVWLALAAVLFGGLFLQNRRLREARQQVEQQKQPVAEVRQLKAQIEALERYGNRSRAGIEVLREVCERLPAGVELAFLSYSKTWEGATNTPAADRKYATVSLRGEADSSEPIYRFFASLEKAPMFKRVVPDGVSDVERQGQRKSQFRVSLELPEEQP